MSDLLVPDEKVGLVNTPSIQGNAAPQVDATAAINATSLRPNYTKVAAEALGFVDTLMLKTDEATSWNLTNKLQRDLSVLQSDAKYKTDERLDLSKDTGGLTADAAKTIYTDIQNKANDLVNQYRESLSKLDPRAVYNTNKQAASIIRSFEVSQIEQKNHEADIALQNNLATAVSLATEGFATSTFMPNTKAWDESLANLRAPIDRMLQAKGYAPNSIEYRLGMTTAISSAAASRVYFDLENNRNISRAKSLYRSAVAEELFTTDDQLKVLTRINNVEDQMRREAEARAARAEARRHRQQGIDRIELKSQIDLLTNKIAKYEGDKNSDEYKGMVNALDATSKRFAATYDLGAGSALAQNTFESALSEASTYNIQLALAENNFTGAKQLFAEQGEDLNVKSLIHLQSQISKYNAVEAKAAATRAGDTISQSDLAYDSVEFDKAVELFDSITTESLQKQGFGQSSETSKLEVHKARSDALTNRVKFNLEDTSDPVLARKEFEYFDKKYGFTREDRLSLEKAINSLEKQTAIAINKTSKEYISGNWGEPLKEQVTNKNYVELKRLDDERVAVQQKNFNNLQSALGLTSLPATKPSGKSDAVLRAQAEQKTIEEQTYQKLSHTQDGRMTKNAIDLMSMLSEGDRRSCHTNKELLLTAFNKVGVQVNVDEVDEAMQTLLGEKNYDALFQKNLTGFTVTRSDQVVLGSIEALNSTDALELGNSAEEIYTSLIDKYGDRITAEDASKAADKLARSIGAGETKDVQNKLKAISTTRLNSVTANLQSNGDVLERIMGDETSGKKYGGKQSAYSEMKVRATPAITQITRELQSRYFPNKKGQELFNACVSDQNYTAAVDKAIEAYVELVSDHADDSSYVGDIFNIGMPIGDFLDGNY